MKQEAKGTGRGPVCQYVTFHLADEAFAINVMQVQEVLRFSEITAVPGAPRHVLGVINLRGNVMTVIDGRIRMGLDARPPDDATCVVIVESGDQVVGVLVDSVAEVIELADSEIEPAPNLGSEESSRYIQGVACRANDLTIVIDPDRLLQTGQPLATAQR